MAAEDEHDLLSRVYLTDVYDRRHQAALAPFNPVILGLRGTGKTALARFLRFQTQRPFDVVVAIDQRTALSRIHADVDDVMSRSRVPFREDICRLWLLAFWTAIMAELQAKRTISSPAVKKYLSLAQPKGALDRHQVLLDGLAASLRSEGTTLLDWDRLRALLDSVDYSRAQQDTQACLDKLTKVALIVDSLEDLPIESKAMSSVATALLTAITRTPETLHPNVLVKCMVPTELWRLLAPEMTMVGKASAFEMRWTQDDLVRLICRRFTNYLGELLGEDAPVHAGAIHWDAVSDVRSRVWGRFFPEKAHGSSLLFEDVETLLMRHTQLRPRQLIFVCNDIASRSHTHRFTPTHIQDSIRARVDDLATGVFAAHKSIYPNAESCLQAHLRGLPSVFQSEDIAGGDDFWRIGYELGVIGPVMAHSRRPFDSADFGGYRLAAFNFCGTGPANWRPHKERVAIHPIFHRRFGVTETAETIVGFDI